MATELSSNWKTLQDAIKAESTRKAQRAPKRKRHDQVADKGNSNKPIRAPLTKEQIKDVGPTRKRRRMGVAQSSKVDHVNHLGVSPSLALWAEDNDISPENLAEAYDLGLESATTATFKDKINGGMADDLELGKFVAIDCEMVGIGPGGHESALARVSLVDYHGNLVYDSFVQPRERVTDWRTSVSGISAKNMRFARDFDEVQKQIAALLQGRILVGHDIKHDLNALEIIHPPSRLRDTSSYSEFRQYATGRKPALRRLAQEILGMEIQAASHSSIEDARVAMLLFRKYKTGFDLEYANRFPDAPMHAMRSSKASKSSKKKRKT